MKGWRTVAWNVLAMISMAAIFRDEIVPPEARQHVMMYHAMLFGGGNIGLRAVTNTPIGRKTKR